jgi:rare lipoprotein A
MIMAGIAMADAGDPAAGTDQAASAAGRADSKLRLSVDRHAMAGEAVRVRGRVAPHGGARVTVFAAGKKVKTVRAKPDGTFALRWDAPGAGIYKLSAFAQGTYRSTRARSRAKQVNVYRAANASYYGPGLYGNGTACGQTLTASTMGVANKSLPCGTKVTFRYRGNTVRVPVIDRGPFSGDREWDLTAATKAKLGFGSTGVVLATK